jgi:hypothetical protein
VNSIAASPNFSQTVGTEKKPGNPNIFPDVVRPVSAGSDLLYIWTDHITEKPEKRLKFYTSPGGAL